MPTNTRPVLPASTSLPSSSTIRTTRAARRPARRCPGQRAGPPASRSSPRRPRSTRRGCRGCRRSGPSTCWRARPGAPSRSPPVTRRFGQPVLVERLLRELDDPLHHHRHDDRAPSPRSPASPSASPPGRTCGAGRRSSSSASAEHEMGEAPGVEERRRDHRPLAGVQRDLREQRRERAERVGLGALRPLRRPGRARGEDHEPARLRGRIEVVVARSPRSARRASCPPSRSRPSSLQATNALQPDLLARLAGLLEQLRELLVVDQRHGPLALDHVGQLRRRRRRCSCRGALAPSLETASVASMKPRWLRHMIATPSPSPTPPAARPRASAFERRCTSAKVEGPGLVHDHRLVGVVDGRRRRSRPAGEAPQRGSTRSIGASLSGRTGRITPASASVFTLNGTSLSEPSGPSLTLRPM